MRHYMLPKEMKSLKLAAALRRAQGTLENRICTIRMIVFINVFIKILGPDRILSSKVDRTVSLYMDVFATLGLLPTSGFQQCKRRTMMRDHIARIARDHMTLAETYKYVCARTCVRVNHAFGDTLRSTQVRIAGRASNTTPTHKNNLYNKSCRDNYLPEVNHQCDL